MLCTIAQTKSKLIQINEERVLFRRINLVVYIFFHRLWIVMVRRLLFDNLFCLQDHLSCKEVSCLLILVHQNKTPFKTAEFIKSVGGAHIPCFSQYISTCCFVFN